MSIKTIKNLLKIADFHKTSKKVFNYFSIFTIVLGSTFGTMSGANAAALSITSASGDIASTNNAGGSDATIAYDTGSTIITTAGDAYHVAYILGDSAGDIFNFGGTLVLNNQYVANAASEVLGVTVAGTINVTGATTLNSAMRTAGGDNTNSSTTLTLKNTSTFTGAVTLNEMGATDVASIVIGDDGTASTVTFTAGLLVQATGEGLLDVNAGGELQTIAGDIGTTTLRIGEVETSTTATFSGAIAAALVDVDDDTTFGSTVNATALNIATGKNATFQGNVTAGSSHLTVIGTATIDAATTQTITGAVEGAGKLDIANTDGTVTFATALGANTQVGEIEASASTTTVFNSTIDTALADIDGHVTINTKDNTGTNITIADGAVLVIDDTIVNGDKVFLTSTGVTNASVVAGGKVKLPANLSDGQTIELFEDVTAGHDDAIVIDVEAVLNDTALRNYTASKNAADDIIITASDRTASDAATQLGTTINESTALLQATIAASTEAATLDAFTNALNAEAGMSAIEDTNLSKQVSPQTDLISGSTIAAQAVTGSVQGIMSNRMASLRSGDAYFGTGVSAGGMSAQSGFIQVFGSTAEQKSTKVGSGTQAGYDSETQGIAIGFDGVTDNGMTVGLSLSSANTDVDGLGTGKSSNSIDSYSASLYMDMATDSGYVEGSVTYGINENTSSRKVTAAGLNRTYTGSYDSTSISLNLTAGAPNEVANGYLTPFGGVTVTNMDTDAYTEKSTAGLTDSLRLKVDQNDVTSILGTVGIKYHTEMSNGGTPMISLALNNELGDNTIDSTNTYQGGGTPFKTSTAVEELSATLGLGYSFGSDSTSIEFAYEADVNDDDYLSHYGSIKIVGKF